MRRFISQRALALRVALIGGLVGMAFAVATPAGAVSTCSDSSLVTFQSAQELDLAPVPLTNNYQGALTVTALCAGQPLSGVSLGVSALSTQLTDLQASVNGGAFVTLPVGNGTTGTGATLASGLVTNASGQVTFTLTAHSASSPVLSSVTQPIGLQFQLVTTVPGIIGPVFRLLGGTIVATPELDSLALFGSGALGLVSYGLLRKRSRGRLV